MWLLNFHLSVSVLCLITILGIKCIFNEQIKENGYKKEGRNKLRNYLIFFIPIFNIISVVAAFVMVTTKKDNFDKFVNDYKKSRSN